MRFHVLRTDPKAKHGRTAQWLDDEITWADAPSKAKALLDNPKDTIVSVKVYNEARGYFMPVTFEKGWSLDGTHKLKANEEQ